MADDKKIKFLMHYRQNKRSETVHPNVKKRREKNFTTNNFLKKSMSFYNDVTIIVHRKKKCRLSTYDSMHLTATFKRKSTSTCYLNTSRKQIPLNYSASLQTLSFCNQNSRRTRSSQNPSPHYTFTKWDVYRCQFSTQEESCCCSCNSDAMFEVMKSLYDCYKQKNCDNCNCILCGHLPREERRLGELRKTGITELGVKEKKKAKRKIKSKELLAIKKAKTPEEKEAALKKLVLSGVALPEPKTTSEKDLIEKVKTQLAMPPQPRSKSEKELYKKAEAEGLITPLEGKTKSQKLKILEKQRDLGLSLPEGRTLSEKALIEKVKSSGVASVVTEVPSEKLRKAKKEGLLTPLEGKTPQQKKAILKGLAMNGIPLPKGKSNSERNLIDQVRDELGLPPQPKTLADKKKYKRAFNAGIITPLEGKTTRQKEDILRKQAEMGLPLPQGRTPSEKSLIAKIKKTTRPLSEIRVPSEKIRKAKAEGLLTPLKGKTKAQKEKILRGLAKNGIPLPEGKTASEKKIIDKVRADLGLPPEPKTSAERTKYKQAFDSGIITPLEGKTPQQKEDILRRQAEIGLPLPQGRTASEKALIADIQRTVRPTSAIRIPSAKMRKAKAEGLLTPLKGKTAAQRENILRGLAQNGIPLPEGKTASEKKIIDKVRADLGLPPEPKTSAERTKYKKAFDSGIITPLEGKTPQQKEDILRRQAEIGLPLPQGRTASEKALIADIQRTVRPTSAIRVPSAKMRKAKAEGLLTPLKGKTAAQRENILRGLAQNGIPLPEGKTASEKKIIDKVRADLGLPPEPKTSAERTKYKKAFDSGIITPLEGKTPQQKEDILRRQAEMGLPLPQGRTASEKALIADIQRTVRPMSAIRVPSAKMRKAKAEGLLTPLKGKSAEQRENILRGLAQNGIPLPEGKTASEKKIIDKVRADLGLPPEPKTSAERTKYKQAFDSGIITPLEGKTPQQKEDILRRQAEMGLPLPQGRTASEKALIADIQRTVRPTSAIRVPSAKMRKAKAEGLLTPLKGKTAAQRENILRGLAQNGIPLPEGKTASEKKIIDKVRADLGLPPEPKTSAERTKYKKAFDSGIITPLEGKTPQQKEDILRRQAEMGLPLPQGRTASEKALIADIQRTVTPTSAIRVPSAKMKKAKAEGLLTPLKGKTAAQRENILRGLAQNGIPLPEGKTASEKKIIDKVRADLGLPPEPKTSAERTKYKKAFDSGLITPLEGKTPKQKEDILRRQAEIGLPLPQGRTASEKALIADIQRTVRPTSAIRVPSAKMRKAKAEGLLTPLKGKTAAQRENILRGLAQNGIPLPEGKTASEKKIIDKVRADLGLPPEPKTSAERTKYKQAFDSGIITPLEGKTPQQKKDILRRQAEIGLPLPQGRTASEKALIADIQQTVRPPSAIRVPSAKLRKAKAEGLLTPLKGKTAEQKENILRGLAQNGIPLPEAKTKSERKIIDKVRADLGLPPEPKTSGEKSAYKKALVAGIITPLEGKTPQEKEDILRKQAEMGVLLPQGRTPSEKAIIAKIQQTVKPHPELEEAFPTGNLAEKEKALKNLVAQGKNLPAAKTPSEEKILNKVRRDLGLPPEPKSRSERERYNQAMAAGIIDPLDGKTKPQKERILQAQADMGIPLPVGRTASEKALIKDIKSGKRKRAKLLPPEEVKKLETKTAKKMKEGKGPSDECICDILTPETEKIAIKSRVPSEKIRKAKEAGLLTPLEGKSAKDKERILKSLAKEGLPLPEPKTVSEKKLIDKIKTEMGIPVTAITSEKLRKAKAAGLMTPLTGKSAKEKERIVRSLAKEGLPLPEPKTASEKKLIDKVKTEMGMPPAVPSEKLRKAKEAGLLTPLKGKTTKEQERILKGLLKEGLPLPEAKTASEKRLITKVKKDLGIPISGITSERLRKAKAAGLITPLDGKPKAHKEKILRGRVAAGLPLPEGVTASDKELIKKIKAETGYITPLPSKSKSMVAKIPSEKLKAAKAAGLLTPLHGKTDSQKEKILKGLALHGIPLPKGETPSERKIIAKVRKDLGLPSEPQTPSLKEKFRLAHEMGIMTPLEGKTPSQKERILRKQAEMGIPLPEGRTASEKELIKKVKSTTVRPIPSEKLRKAKEAGLITPLQGKSQKEKERILKGLAKAGLPLPEGKTASEKQLIKTVKADMGIPLGGISSSKLRKALAEGLITPFEGKSPAQKEKLLKGRVQAGLPLPEGVSPSDKALIKKIKAETGYVTPRTEKLKRVSEVAFPKGPSAERERALKNLVMQGKRLPEAKTPSEEKILNKVTRDLGLPPVPKSQVERDNYNQAIAAGAIVPLEGKTKPQKEKILQTQADMGIPLPEGRTASEKALIRDIKSGKRKREKLLPPEEVKKLETKTAKKMKEGKGPSDECICDILTPETEKIAIKSRVPSEKIRKAKEAGLLTPLEGKSAKDKERILKSLAKEGLPLPEPKTVSEKKLIDKIKTEMGIPVTAITSEKLRKARAAGLLTPITGKSDAEKERILTGLAKNGIPLPKAQTSSERKIIEKVRKDLGLPPEPKTSSIRQKYNQAHEAGIITPLEGKTMAQKENILTEQAKMGLPLPEGRTPSEKDLINRIRKSVPKKKSEIIGEIGGIPITASKREAFQKAKKEGLLTPLKGKSIAEKEKIVRGLAEAGLPLPEGKTPSEKVLIQKVRTALGLPPEPTPSERQGKIKTKSKKIGADRAKMSEVAIGVGKSKIGIKEEFQDIIKTTTCDRGCGCDRKKIRFKHSYVKIRVTSPDISSLCPCPNECVPGVKGGVFTDNEGIKVTVGQVSAAPSFASKEYIKTDSTKLEIKYHNDKAKFSSISSESIKIKSKNELKHTNGYSESLSETYIFIQSSDDSNDSKLSIDISTVIGAFESTLFSSSSNKSILSKSISIISITVSNCSSNSAYLIERTLDYSSQSNESITDLDIIDQVEHYGIARMHSTTFDIDLGTDIISDNILNDHPTILRLSTINNIYNCDCKTTHPNLASIISKILSQEALSENSSLYVLLPTSSENSSTHLYCNKKVSSTICIQLSEKPLTCKGCFDTSYHSEFLQSKQKKLHGFKISAKGRNKLTERHRVPGELVTIKPDGLKMKGCIEICTDTTEDRPCCCDVVNEKSAQKTEMTNVISDLVIPFINNDALSQGLNRENYECCHEISRKKDISYRTKNLGPNQTPVRLCKTPSCGNFSAPTTQHIRNSPSNSNLNQTPTSSKQCECNFEQLKEIIEKLGRDLISKSCGTSTERIDTKVAKPVKNANLQPSSKSHDCISCGSFSKEDLKSQCPCERHASKSKHLENLIPPRPINEINSNADINEKKKNKKKDKKHICECPQVPQEEFDPMVLIDEDYIRRMKSALTQNMSGFKIISVPKVPEPEMSFEEALSYVIQSDQDKYGKLFCLCHEKHGQKKKADCECPPDVVPEKSLEELKGIKLHIGGKGSSSKGLSGILCFQLIDD
ncbi:unnamed protein product [Pieris brassicae]|uniref:Uncharacterized protein n=2 Tax=Pieris brassicae TaxID=7116 RepID=A0A9P0TVI9_PIEBR|nr:unnamed protein product [Pieris brassicae]